jgi:hypothetical protein
MRRSSTALFGAVIGVATLTAASVSALAQDTTACASAALEPLKLTYLACDDLMSRQKVALAAAQRCAAVGQTLQQCAFDGDFDRMIAWWQRERAAARLLEHEFDAALVEYERNHWAVAYAALARLADLGHRDAARLALQMWRYGTPLYGQAFDAAPSQLAAWTRMARAIAWAQAEP